MKEETQKKLKEIKQSFRFLMNGVASQSMRDKGLEYHINWGVSLPHLIEMANEYGKDYELAVELWKEDIRECKILAALIMPHDQMPMELVDIWIEQTKSQEIVEMTSSFLYQYLSYASVLAYQWIASDVPLRQLYGFLVIGKLFANGQEPNERGINEFLDQVKATVQDGGLPEKHAAINSLYRFCELGEEYEGIAKKAFPGFV